MKALIIDVELSQLRRQFSLVEILFARLRVRWERLKYPVYPKRWHATAWRFGGMAFLVLASLLLVGR